VRYRLLSTILALSVQLCAGELPIRLLTTADGLLNNRVGRIVVDSHGLLWMCTAAGLSRFDGAQFQNFGLAEGLPFPTVSDLFDAGDGYFWLATNGGGVVRFSLAAEGPRFAAFAVSSDVTSSRVNLLARTADGAFWAATDGGLFRMTVSADHKAAFTRVKLHLAGRPEEMVQVNSVVSDLEGGVWAGTRFGLVRVLADGRVLSYPVVPGNPTDAIRSLLYPSAGGLLWIGHQFGAAVFRPPPASSYGVLQGREQAFEDSSMARSIAMGRHDVLTRVPELPQKPGEAIFFQSPRGDFSIVRGLSQSAGGVIRALAEHGIVEYSLGAQRFTRLENPRFQSLVLAGSVEDQEGNLWVATTTGVLRVARHGFVTFRASDGMGQDLSRMFEDHEGELIATSQDWRVSRFDGERFQTVRVNIPAALRAIGGRADGDVLQDREGDWWFATRAGLVRFSGVRRVEDLAHAASRLYTARDGLAQQDLLRLFEDSRGDLWMASLIPGRETLTRWERATGRFHSYSEADGLPPFNTPYSFYEDSHGVVWIGLRDGGLVRYEGGRFSMRTEADGVPAGQLSGVTADHQGRLWVTASASGLYRIDDVNARPMRPVRVVTPRELHGDSLSHVVEDHAGNLYVVTITAVFRLDPMLDTKVTGRSPGGHVIAAMYSSSEGLAGSDIVAALVDRRGRLWCLTSEGVSYYQPVAAEHPLALPVRIGSVRIAGRDVPVSPAGELTLSGLELLPGRSQLTIDFFGTSFRAGASLEYEYRLLGADEEWSRSGPLRSVQFSNLAPGDYEFQVRAVSPDGARSPEPASVSFRVLPPIWRRWWFLSLAAAALIGAFATFERYRSRARQVLRDSEERFRTLAETASDAIVTIDDAGVIVYVNATVETIFGYTAAELVGRDLTILMPETMRDRHRRGMARYRATGERRLSWRAIELPGLHKDGREIPLEVGFGEFTREDRHYFTGMIRDISDRKRAEQTLRKAREERLEELERVRQRIAADLHDEIGSSLTQISILSEVAHRSGAASNPELTHSLSTIAASSRELVDSMSDIVWAINPAKDHLKDLTQRMRRVASDTFTTNNMAFRLEMPPSEEDWKLGANLRREIFLIYKEGIHNMVKHSGCTEAVIRVTSQDGALRLELRDNGKGFDPSSPSDGHGLASLRSRAAALGGTLSVVSAPGRGTEITFHLPIPT
jgi:PAS domain S-box-containing protein